MELRLRGSFLSFRIYDGPDNIPCLILNGTANVADDFNELATELSKERPVCVYDYMGMGKSGPEKDDLTLLQTATDAFDLLEMLGWKRFYLIGHSFGGIVALELILLLRGRDDFFCCGLVLLSTSAKILAHGSLCSLIFDTLRNHSIGVNGKSFNDMERKSKIALSAGIVKACAPDINVSHTDRNIHIIEQQIYLQNALELVEMLHLVSELPVISIFGLKDTVSDLHYIQPISQEFSNVRIVRLEEAPFWTWSTCFQETVRPINSFFT